MLLNCLVYLPLPFNGRGPAASCVAVLKEFLHAGIQPILFLPRARTRVHDSIELRESLLFPLSHLPWKLIRPIALEQLNRAFEKAVASQDPQSTIAYFWPQPPLELVQLCRRCGIPAVREMINSPRITAKRLLDDAYRSRGLIPSHTLSTHRGNEERIELGFYDYIFASNPEVEKAIGDIGVPRDRIISSSFGWNRSLISGTAANRKSRRFTALFVGSLCVRKGILDLLEAWVGSGIDGDLILAGAIDSDISARVHKFFRHPNIHHVGFVDHPSKLYEVADVFVFPTYEEGGPQVTYEAAAHGLPIVTTPMGAARLVETGITGYVVPAGNVEELQAALIKLAAAPELRRRLGEKAMEAAEPFEYTRVSLSRAHALRMLFASSGMSGGKD